MSEAVTTEDRIQACADDGGHNFSLDRLQSRTRGGETHFRMECTHGCGQYITMDSLVSAIATALNERVSALEKRLEEAENRRVVVPHMGVVLDG